MKTSSFALLLAGFLCFSTACQSQNSADLIATVNVYADAHNTYAVDDALALFAEDAAVEAVGLGRFESLEDIRALHTYDKGIHAQLSFENCTAAGLTVTCEVYEHNDWGAAAGLEDYHYPSSVFTFTPDGKIKNIVTSLSEPDQVAIAGVLDEFIPWLITSQPEATQQLFTPDGEFIYSESNGVRVVELLHQWRQEQNNG